MKRKHRPHDPMFDDFQDDLSQKAITPDGKLIMPLEVEVAAGGHDGGAFKGDVKAQTKHILRNLEKAVEAQGATLNDIFQLRVYIEKAIADQTDEINAQIDQYFEVAHPTIFYIPTPDIENSDFLIELEALVFVDDVQPEINKLRSASDNPTRYEAMRILKKKKHRRVNKPLLALLTHEDRWVRVQTARLLADIGDPIAVPHIIAAMQADDPDHRYEYVGALGKLGDPMAVEAILAVARHTIGWGVVEIAVAEAFTDLPDPRAIPVLKPMLRDTYQDKGRPRVCDAAAKALRKIGTPEALAALEYYKG